MLMDKTRRRTDVQHCAAWRVRGRATNGHCATQLTWGDVRGMGVGRQRVRRQPRDHPRMITAISSPLAALWQHRLSDTSPLPTCPTWGHWEAGLRSQRGDRFVRDHLVVHDPPPCGR